VNTLREQIGHERTAEALNARRFLRVGVAAAVGLVVFLGMPRPAAAAEAVTMSTAICSDVTLTLKVISGSKVRAENTGANCTVSHGASVATSSPHAAPVDLRVDVPAAFPCVEQRSDDRSLHVGIEPGAGPTFDVGATAVREVSTANNQVSLDSARAEAGDPSSTATVVRARLDQTIAAGKQAACATGFAGVAAGTTVGSWRGDLLFCGGRTELTLGACAAWSASVGTQVVAQGSVCADATDSNPSHRSTWACGTFSYSADVSDPSSPPSGNACAQVDGTGGCAWSTAGAFVEEVSGTCNSLVDEASGTDETDTLCLNGEHRCLVTVPVVGVTASCWE